MLYQALNGELALKIAIREQPEIIITDWEMPGMDGIELIKRLKQNESTSDTPIIMCTGVMTSSENLHTALSVGAVDYIRKPIDKIELLARIKSMLMLSDSRKVLKEKYLEIQQDHKFIRSLMESIPNPMVYYNPEGKIQVYNQSFERFINFQNLDISKFRIQEIEPFSKNEIHRFYDIKIIKDGLDATYEYELKGRSYVIAKTLFLNLGSAPQGIMCILTDVTELKNAHNDIIENKKRELATYALRLIQISELNKSIISDLRSLNSLTNQEGSELIRQSINKFNINSGKGFWDEFESRFENVYESFYTKLNTRYPELTPREKKLCALLRLNLSSKEIATIIFQNPHSVDVARFRLRKKLDLSQEENLVDFLMKIN